MLLPRKRDFFVRLNHAIDSIGAPRVVLDTLESLFAAPPQCE